VTPKRSPCIQSGGFTLVELTIVLVIIALLTSGMVISFSTQKDITDSSETLRQLNTINDALLGYAATFQRLPCPASTTSAGQAAYCANASGACGAEMTTPIPDHGRCAVPHAGFLPAATLGISPTDAQGFAVDRWNNRIRYAVSHGDSTTPPYQFTAASMLTSGLKMAWAGNTLSPDLRVCRTATGITGIAPNTSCAAGASLTDTAVAVVLSGGKNGGTAPPAANLDELANWTSSNDRTFVSRTPSQNFDDIVVWLSPNLLYNRLIAASRLP
jgi:prepilin-type N-terminal cleavage/methylation domain-containing protein